MSSSSEDLPMPAAARSASAVVRQATYFVGAAIANVLAAQGAGARTEVLDGLGHWWMMQDPARGAAALTRFWETLD